MKAIGSLGAALLSMAMLACNADHKPAQAPAPAAPAVASLDLVGSEWVLEDLAGAGVVDRAQASLAFPEAGKVAGNGSCNRFFGTLEISGNTLKLSPLGATRMACPEAVMNQETKYLAALQGAERYEWKDPYLLIYCKGFDQPLRFTRRQSPKASAGQDRKLPTS